MSAAPPPKELARGRYVLLSKLGQGAQGTTWDAVDKREGRAVAIKAFDVRGARAWKDVELAEREARVLSELRHPLLPRYVEHFEDDGVLYLVMEKVEGTPLSVLHKKGGGLSEADVTRFLRDADTVLTYLHGRAPPVIHRDLKPSNVIRRPDGSFAFVDFGAVKDHLRPEGGSTVVGTFGYMAPEQFQGRAGPATDVYAVGATAIAMLTGLEPEKLPHRGLTLDVDAAVGARGSRSLREALARMLEPDPDKRAPRIAPLLGSMRADAPRARNRPDGRERPARAAAPATAPWQPDFSQWDFGDARYARRAARRAAKQASRRSRQDTRRGTFRLPFVLRFPVVVALTAARLLVTLLLRGAVPMVLTLLSVFFGRAFRQAAQQVRRAGNEVDDALDDARGKVQRNWGPESDARPRVADSPGAGARVRVATRAKADPEAELAAEVDDDEPEAEKRKQSRSRW